MIFSGAITPDNNGDAVVGDVWHCERGSSAGVVDGETRLNPVRRQVRLLVCLIFAAFLLDGVLWTVVVPILPLYLHELNPDHDVERTRTSLPPVSDDVTRQHQGDDVTPRQFALASDTFYEWVDGSSRQADRQWLLERLLWLRQNWTESVSNTADNASLSGDYEDILSAGDDRESVSKEIVDFQREDGKLGILLAAKAIAQIVSNPLVGLIINRFDYQAPLLAGIISLILSCTIYAIGTNYVLLVTARAIHGVASSLINIAGLSALAQNFVDGSHRSRSMGIALSGTAAGVLIGYPFGGLSIELSASSMPFIVIAVCSSVAFALLLWTCTPLSTTDQTRAAPANPVRTFLRLLTDPHILIAAGALLVPELAMATVESTVPTWMLDTMNPKKWQLGTVFIPNSIGFFIGCIVTSYVSSRIGVSRVTLGALVLSGLSLFTLPFSTEVSHLIAPHFALGLSLGLIGASVMPQLAHLVDVRHVVVYGSVYSLAQIAICFGFAVGPAVGGHLAQLIGFQWLLRSLAVLVVGYAPLCCVLKDQVVTEENTSILPRTISKSTTPTCDNAMSSPSTDYIDPSFNYQKLL